MNDHELGLTANRILQIASLMERGQLTEPRKVGRELRWLASGLSVPSQRVPDHPNTVVIARILHDHFRTGEPGEIDAIKSATAALLAALTSTVRWPAGCHDPDSCARHKACMYIQCKRHGKDGNEVAEEISASTER